MTKAKSAKKGDHVLHEVLPLEIRERQPPSQWGYGEGDKRWVSYALLFICGGEVKEPEVVEIWEEANEIQDLSAGAVGTFESKESKGR